MRKTVKLKSVALMTAAAFIAQPAYAIQVTGNIGASDLANQLFLEVPGLSNVQASTSGDSSQFGTYTNDSGTYGLPESGIVLSTGNVSDYSDGPNEQSGNTTGFGVGATPEQEALLDPITGGNFNHNDVAQLTISFDAGPDVDSVTFFGAFGSEEFPEFVGSNFIDGFGLFVNGKNVAFVNDQPININHPDFLGAVIDDGGDFPDDEISVLANVEQASLAQVVGTELDGLIAPGGNPVLEFVVPVEPGEANVFDIIIADTSDNILDSTVFLSSFSATEFDLNDGSTEFTPLLPNDPDPNNPGLFVFDLTEIPDLGEIFFIDPPVAVGYTYTVADAEFKEVMAPSLATIPDVDGYFIEFAGSGGLIPLAPGQVFDVSAFNVTEITLTGIDPSLMLDPLNSLAFPFGVSFQNLVAGGPTPTLSQQAIVSAIPLPAGLPLYLSALFGLFLVRRFRSS